MKKYDVGIYGLWYGNNYGSMITYYALSKIIESMGKTYAMIKNPLGANVDVSKLCNSHPLKFAAEHYTITPLYPLKDMSKHNDMFDTFLIGSDQMWNYFLSKGYKQSYFLDFADDNKNKIAYGCSFGHQGYDGPESEKALTKKNLARFNAVSVRDNFSQSMCKDIFGIDATLVYDPVFLCPVEHYESLIANTRFNGNEEEFIFAYILDPNPKIGKAITDIAIRSGKKIQVIFDQLFYNTPHDINEFYNLLGVNTSDNIDIIDDPNVNEWLYCFKNAEFVLTDSFHGCCFSVIFKKPFIVMKNNKRGGGRFPFLLGGLGLLDRMVESPEAIYEKFCQTGLDNRIDYEKVYSRISEEKDRSVRWLKTALNKKNKNLGPITSLLDIRRCTGCGACVNICPTDALKLSPNKYGYYKAELVSEKCINCGKCSSICPAFNLPPKNNSVSPELYAFTAKDDMLVDRSSSGGAFSVLAKKTLNDGGCVVGAAWTDEFTVKHILIDSDEELEKLRKSKYMQSYIGLTYRAVKEKLDQKRTVLFSGCPCQVAGIKAYLGKDYDDLIVIDILCSNAPSAMFFKKYLDDLKQTGLAEYEFRTKDGSWNCFTEKITYSDGKTELRKRIRDDDYQRVYHSHVMCPEHCEYCKYQSIPRFGDLSIGDFWGISKKFPEIDTKKGVSAILCNTKKGSQLLKKITENDCSLLQKVPLETLGGNGYALNGHNFASPYRDLFYELICDHSFSESVKISLKPFYREMYRQKITDPTVQCNTRSSHFVIDNSVWRQYFTDKSLVLTVPSGNAVPKKYASLFLGQILEKEKKYTLHIRFCMRTASDVVYLHIKASENDDIQKIAVIKNSDELLSPVTMNIDFTPDSAIYDEFTIGASQISGKDNFFALEWLYIT